MKFKTRRKINKNDRMVLEVAPGKKGGEFNLPFGGKLTALPGVLHKKHVITCCMVSPSNRYKHLPPIGPDERLTSEVFLFSTSSKRLKCTFTLALPYVPATTDMCDVALYHKKLDEDEWSTCPFQYSESGNFVEVDVNASCILVAVCEPRCERFELPVQGCLYNAKIHRQLSIRIPKKATDSDQSCDIRIIPVNRESFPVLRREQSHIMSDLVQCSDIYSITPSLHKEFRRLITVKLPLPVDLVEEHFNIQDLVVMRWDNHGEWLPLEVSYRFTKNSVSFDTRILSRFCVALAKPSRQKRMKEVFKHLEREQTNTRGEVLPFLHLQEKIWTLWVDVVPVSDREETIYNRTQQGFRQITQHEVVPEPENPNKIVIRRNWRSRRAPPQPEEKTEKRDDVDLINGSYLDLELSGDVEITEEDPGRGFLAIHYHSRLKQSYRKFHIQPNKPELVYTKQSAIGLLKVLRIDENTGNRTCLRTFDIEIESDAVEQFYHVEPEPEPIEESPEEDEEEEMEATPSGVTSLDRKHESEITWRRLTKPTRPPRLVSKESRVLSGRSLLTLAREVEQGLSLAIHLNLTDSTITGMGFDALARGHSLSDITYKVLLLWKRRTSRFKEQQVEMLVRALQEMGHPDVAHIIQEKHSQNQELTPACFDSSALH